MTYLKDTNVRSRLEFAKAMRHHPTTYWRSVRFTDEVHFALESRGAAWVIRNENERCDPTCIQYKIRSKGSQLHAWAMVGYGYKGPLVFFDSNDNSEPSQFIWQTIGDENDAPQPVKETLDEEAQLLGDRAPSKCKHRCKDKESCQHECCKAGYRNPKLAGNLTMTQYLTKIFHPHIEKAWQQAKDRHEPFVLLEDNDGSHGTRTTNNLVAKYKARIGIPWFANAARSPDLNIIENVWRILKQRLKQRMKYEQGTSIAELQKILQDIWSDIDLREINALVDTMPARIYECLRRKGLNTPF